MRKILILLGTTSLAACSGGGPTTVGGSAVTGGVIGATSTHTFVNPTEPKTYQATGGVQHYAFATTPGSQQYSQVYSGDANTARDTGYQITFNPRDGIFDLAVVSKKTGTDLDTRFQDPVHRTAFGGAREPEPGTPNLESKGVLYFENGSRTGIFNRDGYSENFQTFFYQKPGTTTKYVTYAGYQRNKINQIAKEDGLGGTFIETQYERKRAAFVYGERSSNGAVPITGTGTFTGQMLGSMIYNPMTDIDALTPSYFQFMDGNSTTTVDFAANTFSLNLTATIGPAAFDLHSDQFVAMPAGAIFTANGNGRVDLIKSGGFLGQITDAYFTNSGVRSDLTIAGSSIDGAFYGPTAQEVGGGFRIVGGTPDQRIDILGVFTGAR